jgi:hypothetical protein
MLFLLNEHHNKIQQRIVNFPNKISVYEDKWQTEQGVTTTTTPVARETKNKSKKTAFGILMKRKTGCRIVFQASPFFCKELI